MRFLSWLVTTALAVAVATLLIDGIYFTGPVHGQEEIQHKLVPLLLVAVVKALLPSDRLRRASNPVLTGVAESWIGVNNWMMDRFTGTRVGVEEDAALQVDGHYLVLANHQSWVDILVLQKVFNRRIPLLRFFLKRQLFWVPVLGLAWWALDFPFMGRYTRKQIAKNPELGRRDIEATRRACAKFRDIPVAVMNFVEGTRFTPEKHAGQASPYRHLLRPKSGGVAFVLDAMGEGLHALLDVTIAYPGVVDTQIRYRGFNAQGQASGLSSLDERGAMSVQACARLILDGTLARERDIVMTAKGKLGRWLKLLAPAMVDRMALKALKKEQRPA